MLRLIEEVISEVEEESEGMAAVFDNVLFPRIDTLIAIFAIIKYD